MLPRLFKRASEEGGDADRRLGWGGSLAIAGLGSAATALPTTAYHFAFGKPTVKNPSLFAERGLQTAGRQATEPQVAELMRRVGLHPSKVQRTTDAGGHEYYGLPAHARVNRWQKISPLPQGGEAYGVHTPASNRDPIAAAFGKPPRPRVSRGVVAHELGHAATFERLHRLGGDPLLFGSLLGYGLGKPGMALGSLGAAFAPSDRSARISALVGTAMTAPMLAHELAASHVGGRALAGMHGGPLSRRVGNYLSAYRGMPTYAVGAASPLLTYAARRGYKHLRGLHDRGDTKKS